VNSSTSNFNLHRSFTLGLLIAALMSLVGLFTLGLYLQPVSGDLVRIGGYAEREYGWNLPQQAFTHPLYNRDHYDQYYDIVILGDSFSDSDKGYLWQNYLASLTKQSVIVLSHPRGVKFNDILNNSVFRNTPPKLLIYENVERDMNFEFDKKVQCNITPKVSTKDLVIQEVNQIALPIDWKSYVANQITYITREKDLQSIKLGEVLSNARNYIVRNFLRNAVGLEITRTVRHTLNRPAPFSSMNIKTLLTYDNDLLKTKTKIQAIEKTVCQLAYINEQVESNGQTRFVYMIPPDKLTAYAEFLADEKLRQISFISALAQRLPTIVPRIDLSIQSAIHAGEMDIYLPDDTHWGWRGHQIAAETLLVFLKASGSD
jgi:hypothetical protein